MSNEYALEKITSISQLKDVSPNDWYFPALQCLIERYGIVRGYPDHTFRGNQPMTRAEVVVLVNAALDCVHELIADATADFVRKEDLRKSQKG